MNDRELRLECLRLAQAMPERDLDSVLKAAREMSDFVIGARDAKIIDAAHAFEKALSSP